MEKLLWSKSSWSLIGSMVALLFSSVSIAQTSALTVDDLTVTNSLNSIQGLQVNGSTIIDGLGNITGSSGSYSGTVNANQGVLVNGITVINQSRGLQNINGITSSGAINTTGSYQVSGVTVIDYARNLAAVSGNFSGGVSVSGVLSANGGVATTTLNSQQGIQVGGTTVIDSNRNLLNIAGLSASGSINTATGYQVGGTTVIDALRNLVAANGSFSGALSVTGALAANGGLTTTSLNVSGDSIISGSVTAGNIVNAANGYQVGGTTVIDANRNLVNVANITASGNINTAGTYQVAGVTVIDAQRNLNAVNGSFSGNVSVTGSLTAGTTNVGALTAASLVTTGTASIGGNATLGGNRTYLAGFDANNQHWIALAGGVEPTSLFLGFEKNSNGANRMIANVPMATIDGTAAAPAIGFSSAPGTGIFSPAINALGLSSAGVERLRIDSAGNTSIGNLNGNYLQISADNAAARLSAQGSANDIALYLSAKGNGYIVAQSVLTFASSAQSSEGTSCPQIGAITTDANGDILTCK